MGRPEFLNLNKEAPLVLEGTGHIPHSYETN